LGEWERYSASAHSLVRWGLTRAELAAKAPRGVERGRLN
jgi:hypothetical protein